MLYRFIFALRRRISREIPWIQLIRGKIGLPGELEKAQIGAGCANLWFLHQHNVVLLRRIACFSL